MAGPESPYKTSGYDQDGGYDDSDEDADADPGGSPVGLFQNPFRLMPDIFAFLFQRVKRFLLLLPGFPDIFGAAVGAPEQVVLILKSAVRADHAMYSSVSVRRLVAPRGLNIL